MSNFIEGSGVLTTIVMSEGTDETVRVTVTDGAGNAVNVTGATGNLYVRDDPETTTTINLTKAITVVDGPSGIIEATIAAADTTGKATTANVNFYHEMVMTLAGETKVVIYGPLILRPSTQ